MRLPEGVLVEHRNSAFAERGWHWSEVDDGLVIAMPIYCARRVSLSVARGEIQSFSQQHFPLVIDDLRLFSPPSDTRLRAQVRRTAGGWVDLWPEWFRKNSEVSVGAMQWEVAVARSEAPTVAQRRSDNGSRARLAAGASELPGEVFDPETMEIYTAAAPAKVTPELSVSPRKSLGFILITVVSLLAITGGSALAWSPVTLWARFLGGAVAAALVVVAGLWATGDRQFWWARAGVIAVMFVFGALVGAGAAMLSTHIDTVVKSFLIALVVCVVYFGWVHLVVLHRGIRGIWSIPLLSLIAAVSAVLGRSAVAVWLGDFGVPSENVAVPGWFHLLAAGYVGGALVGVVILLGSLCGWARYYGAGAGGLMTMAQAFLGVLLIALLWGLSTFTALALLLSDVIGGWEQDLVESKTPTVTAEFLYAGCVIRPDGAVERVAVLEGADGAGWTMEVTEGKGETPALGPAKPAPADGSEILRADGEDERCRS